MNRRRRPRMVRTSRLASATSSLQFGEGSDETARVKLMVKGLSGIGLGAVGSDVRVGLMPDQGKRVRHQAIVVATPTSSILSRLVGVLDGPPEGIIQFHELPGVRILNEPKKNETILFFGSYIRRTTSEGCRMRSRRCLFFARNGCERTERHCWTVAACTKARLRLASVSCFIRRIKSAMGVTSQP